MDDAAAAVQKSIGATPPRRLARSIGVVVLGIVAVLSLCALLVVWSLGSERGSAWLLAWLPGVKVEGARGALLGNFEARRVVVALPGQDSLTLTALRWTHLTLSPTHAAPGWRLQADTLSVERVDLSLTSGAGHAAPQAPASLRWPIDTQVADLRIGELHVSTLGETPLRDIRASVHLSAREGAEHRIDALALRWERVQLRGSARSTTGAPLQVTASLGVAQAASPAVGAWSAAIAVTGPWVSPRVEAQLRAAPASGHAAQSLDARAILRPFDAWPLDTLQATTTALDLSAFSPSAPATALNGRAVVSAATLRQSAEVSIEITNTLAQRWSEAGLPVRSLSLEATTSLAPSRSVTLHRFDAELGTQRASAGHLSGQGEWSNERWRLTASLRSLRPDGVDARGPAMQLQGNATLSGTAAAPLDVQVQAALNGQAGPPRRAGGTPSEVQVRLDASVSPQRVEVRAFQALAAGTQARLSGILTTPPDRSALNLKAQGSLVDFDPQVWWPGDDSSPWRRATHRMNATATAQLELPHPAHPGSLAAWLAAVRGQADVTIGKSVLAGVPLTGHAELHALAGVPAQIALALNVDGNQLRADAHVDVAGPGTGDVWDLDVQAPSLERLQPILRLAPGWGSGLTLSGKAAANATLAGRWPSMTTRGHLEASDLRIAQASLAHAQASWSAGSLASAPLTAQVTLRQLRGATSAGQATAFDTVTLQLQGTANAHTLEVHGESARTIAPWAQNLSAPDPTRASIASTPAATDGAPAPPAHTVVAEIRIRGGLVSAQRGEFDGWNGAIEALELSGDGTPWFQANDLEVAARWTSPAARLQLQAGHAQILGAKLHWSALAWQFGAPGDNAQGLSGAITLDPVAVAPVLARFQPDFGWGGDLTVGAQLDLGAPAGAAAGFHAHASVARAQGDLSVTDELGTRVLGLSELALDLTAQDGVWTLNQHIVGKAVGVLSATAVVHAAQDQAWPGASAPIEGSLALDVADLGSWGDWVPPGWRIGGTLQAYARLGGRVGAPEYTGAVVGKQLSLRNFLFGVDATDGELAVRLDGRKAQIDRFTAKAGKGLATVQGRIDLGAAPSSTLQINASKFQLLGRVDRRIVTSGVAELKIDSQSIGLTGRFGVDEGLIDFTRSDAPGLSDDVRVTRGVATPGSPQKAATPEAPGSSPSAGRSVSLDLNVSLGDQLRLRGRGLDTKLGGELRITSPAGRLAVNGTVRTVDGTYAAYNQKLSVDRGAITFSGAMDNPRLDIEATRPNIDTRVGVQITGTATNPRVRLFSEPELSDIDKLSWLVLGRASDGLGGTDTALLQHAALALLAGEGGGLTGQLTKAVGLDDVSIRQQTDGTVQETVVSLGKQISQRWYVGYEHGLNATAGGFQLIYRIAQRFTLRMQSGSDNSVDLIWSWRWH